MDSNPLRVRPELDVKLAHKGASLGLIYFRASIVANGQMDTAANLRGFEYHVGRHSVVAE